MDDAILAWMKFLHELINIKIGDIDIDNAISTWCNINMDDIILTYVFYAMFAISIDHMLIPLVHWMRERKRTWTTWANLKEPCLALESTGYNDRWPAIEKSINENRNQLPLAILLQTWQRH